NGRDRLAAERRAGERARRLAEEDPAGGSGGGAARALPARDRPAAAEPARAATAMAPPRGREPAPAYTSPEAMPIPTAGSAPKSRTSSVVSAAQASRSSRP